MSCKIITIPSNYHRRKGIGPSGEWYIRHKGKLFKYEYYYGCITDNVIKRNTNKYKDIEKLCIQDSEITDKSIKHISHLIQLKEISLGGTSISDKNLKYLCDCKKLNSLYIWETKITNKGLKYLANSNIKRLFLSYCKKINDYGMKYLQNSRCRELDISHTNITDKGIEYLSKLKTLRILRDC